MSVKGARSEVRANIKDLNKVHITLELTMTYEDWIAVRKEINDIWPASVFSDKIADALHKIYVPLNQVTDFGSAED